ncbi:MAG: IS66 family insertion sequence element accessory protein TnpB [Candidatus Saccharimonadales bacterium]
MSLLHLSASRNYYLYNGKTDMRRTFNGLTAIVRGELGYNPLSGDVFIFFNRQRTQVKLLLWMVEGFEIYQKRLERGTFELPVQQEEATGRPIPWQDLQFILQGVELGSVRFRKRYQRKTLVPA